MLLEKPSEIDVSIIIVSYNTADIITGLFSSIEEHLKYSDYSYEIIVVDNNSGDETRQILSEYEKDGFLQAHLLKKNLGFGAANNYGARFASGKYLLLLNPDTVLLEDSISKILRFVNAGKKPAVVGVKLLSEDYSYQESKISYFRLSQHLAEAFFLNRLFPQSPIFNGVSYGWQNHDEFAEVECIRGAFMFMDKSIFDVAGGFDEDFFLYSEEVDLCYRIGKAGIPIYYFPETSVLHLEGRSMDLDRLKTFIELYKSKLLFIRKHRGKTAMYGFRVILFFSVVNRTILNGLLALASRNKLYYNKFQLFFYSGLWFLGFPITKLNRRIQLLQKPV